MSYSTNLNTYLNPTPETILRRGNYGPVGYQEAPCSVTNPPYPGMLIQLNSDGTVGAQTSVGGNVPKQFAIEDALQGYTINDQYVANNVVRFIIAPPGTILQAPIPAGFSATVGDMMVSYGDGSLVPEDDMGIGTLYTTTANSNTVTNTTAETSFGQTYTIPAKTLQDGDVLKFTVSGFVPSANSTDTLNVKLKMGSTVVAATGAVDITTNDAFQIEMSVVIRTDGASGVMTGGGFASLGVAGTGTGKVITLAPTAVNTNANILVDVTATYSAASTSDQAYMTILDIEKTRSNPQGLLAMAVSNTNNNTNGYEFVDVQIL